MNQATGHLTESEIETYVSQDSTKESDAQCLRLEAHLTDCEPCLGRVLHAERNRLGLLEGDRMKETPYSGCPPEETLQELAAGIAPPETAEATTEHAAHCDFCGPRLSRYLREFSEPLEAEDAALVKQLETSKPNWQKKFVREHVADAEPRPKWSLFGGLWPKMAMAGAGVAIAAVLFIYLRPADDLRQAQKLVASAYSERRTTEMRLTDVPYARYAPLPVERAGTAGTALSYERPSLLKAGAAVGDKLKSGSNLDPRWLQVKGRIALLEAAPGSAKDAQAALEKARSEGLSDPSLEIDLAASYFERAIHEDNPDLSVTINFLKAALDNPKISSQDRLAALFDLAVAYQRSKMFDLAINTWGQYLELDSSSDWAKEAQERLAEAKKAAPPPRNQGRLEMQKPLFFLNHISDPHTLAHLDVYQDRALRFWLPDAVRDHSGRPFQASYKLAELLEQHDSDSWMKEFLASLKRNDAPAADALSAAIRANRKGFYDLAVERSRAAARVFAQHGNVPGELRARFESIYASQRFLEGFDCLAQLASVEAPDRYRWLQIQLALEKYTCSNFGGDFAAIAQGLESNRRNAENSHFYLLALRAIALEAGIKRQQQAGCREVWEQAIQGLDLYWRYGDGRPEPLYELYSILEQCAAQMRLWHAAEALQKRSIALVESANQDDDPNLILEGSAHTELAAILTAEHRDADADVEQNLADSEWNQVRNERTADTYRLFMRIYLAEIQLDRGASQRALATLTSSRGLLTSTQYQLLSLDFYRLLGKTCLRLHRLSDAASAYMYGISIAENSLRSIKQNAKDRLRWVTKTDEVYRGMTRVWLEQDHPDQAWKLWEWYRTRSLLREIGLASPGPLNKASQNAIESEIARVTFPSNGHLVYASFEDGVEAWTVDRTGVRAHWIPIQQAALESLVNDFAEKCADPSSPLDEVHAQAQKLYDLLLQPLIADVPEPGTLVVELDRALSRLVVPALMDANGKYIAQIHPVVYSPGILMEETLRAPTPIGTTDRVLFVDASEPTGTGTVPGHLEEQAAAFRVYSQVKLLSGDRTTPAEIQRELLRSTAFDFVGHGEQHGSRTELRLSAKSSLRPEDFPASSLTHIKLSILAACSTATSGDDRLLDTDNLVHSFLSAGVPDVIASQWNVDSSATAQLMQAFHAHLGAGQGVTQAMYQAQKEILTSRNHPYFWAGFNLSGRAN